MRIERPGGLSGCWTRDVRVLLVFNEKDGRKKEDAKERGIWYQENKFEMRNSAYFSHNHHLSVDEGEEEEEEEEK